MNLLKLPKFLVFLLIPAMASVAQAQTFKCSVGGKSVYSDTPCARDAKRADAPEDSVPRSEQIARLRQSAVERSERNAIEQRNNAEYWANQSAYERLAAQDAARAAAEERARAARRKK